MRPFAMAVGLLIAWPGAVAAQEADSEAPLSPPPLLDANVAPPAEPPPQAPASPAPVQGPLPAVPVPEPPPAPPRLGPTMALAVAVPLNGNNVAIALRGGARYALSERDPTEGVFFTAAGLVGVEHQGLATGASLDGRLELVGASPDALLPYLYGYAFAGSGLLWSGRTSGMLARGGVGLGWNLFASAPWDSHADAHACWLPAAGCGRGDLGSLVALLLFLVPNFEVYFERLQLGSLVREGWWLSFGIGL